MHLDFVAHDCTEQNLCEGLLAAGLGSGIGWHSFRHTYRTWLDQTGAPVSVQRELMRHADIQTTMNVYGRAVMSEAKRQANAKVVGMALKVTGVREECRRLLQ